MNNWTKQAENIFQAWTGTQQQMWNNWLQLAQQTTQPQNPAELWRKSVDAWEEAIENSVEAQKKWNRLWAESSSNMVGMPPEMVQLAKQAQEMNNRFHEAQLQLWRQWFQLAKNMEPANFSPKWNQDPQQAFQMWQAATQQVMQAQSEMSKTWMANGTVESINN